MEHPADSGVAQRMHGLRVGDQGVPGLLDRAMPTRELASAVWLGRRPTEYAPRFAAAAQRDAGHLTTLVASARKRLTAGGDVSLGFYLERPSYLSLAIVSCAPHREHGGLPCPLGA